jgi:hypothetical protein
VAYCAKPPTPFDNNKQSGIIVEEQEAMGDAHAGLRAAQRS